MAFKPVAKLADIPEGTGFGVEIDGFEIGLYRLAESGEIRAMENSCPHAGYPLHRGYLEGTVIVCQLHGWPFDVCSGRMPGNSDGFALDRYPTRVEGDDVLVDLENPIRDERGR